MDKEAIRRTRDLIAKDPSSYKQTAWAHPCGTPACIAGFACVANGGELFDTVNMSIVCIDQFGEKHGVSSYARTRLGLTHSQAADLFRPDPFEGRGHYRPASPEDAIATLDHMLEHGLVEWQEAG